MSQVDGVRMCYHETNWCNLHPDCDDAEDEDEMKCGEKYKEKFKKGAMFPCQSRLHNDDTVKAKLSRGVVRIKAVAQDGTPECWNNEDELPTDRNVTYGIPGNIQRSSYIVYLVPKFFIAAADDKLTV